MELLKLNIQMFASGTIDLGASGNLQGRIVWSSSSNGSVENSSNGSASLQIRKGSSSAATTGTFSYEFQAFGKGAYSSWYGSIGTDWVTIATLSDTVSHKADGSGSSYIYGKVTGPSGTTLAGLTVSGNQTVTLDKIARYPVLNNGSNFTDEGNPTLSFTNYGAFSVRVKIEAGGNNKLITRDISKTATSYTIRLTEEERNKLRALCPNSNSLSVLETVCAMDGTTELSASYKTYTMTIVNANPTFNDFSFEDVNEKTLALTGNNQNIIRNYSNVKATIPAINKAEALKSATMSKYRFNCNGNSTDINYSSDSDVEGTLNGVKSGVFDVYAIDSRNNSTLVTKNANSVIDYTPIVKGNISVARANGVSESVTLKLDGKVDLVNFGVVTNEIKQSKYRYRATDSAEWSDYTDLTLTVDTNGDFTFNGLISGDTEELGFNISNSYQVEVLIADELSQVVYTATFGSGIPNIALSKNGVGIMGKYDEEVGGLLQVGGKDILNNASFARVAKTDIASLTSEKTLQTLQKVSEIGDYVCDITNHRIIIKNTKLVQISGKACGSNYMMINYNLHEAETNANMLVGADRQTLVQFAGNGYWSIALPTITVELDPNKTYYLTLSAGPYNTSSCTLNNGFSGNPTWFSALKIK